MQQEDGSRVPESQAYESIFSFTQILMVCLLQLSFSMKIALCDIFFSVFSIFILVSVSLSFQSSNVVQDVSNPYSLKGIDGWEF